MTMILMLVAGALATAAFAGEAPLACWLRRILVDAPASWLNDAGPLKLLVLLLVGLFIAAAPEIGVLFAVDLTTFLEITAAAMLVVGQLGLRNFVQRSARLLQGVTRGFRAGPPWIAQRAARAVRSVGRRLSPPADDPDGWALA